MAEQLGVADPSCIKNYPERLPTQHEHAREIRGLLGYLEFADAEAEVRTFVASRAAQTRDSRRELFDRAVLWLIGGRVLLPGITTLAQLVTSVRAEQLAAINDHLVEQTPLEMRRELLDTLVVPEGRKVSPLEWMRTARIVREREPPQVRFAAEGRAGHGQHVRGGAGRDDPVPGGGQQVADQRHAAAAELEHESVPDG